MGLNETSVEKLFKKLPSIVLQKGSVRQSDNVANIKQIPDKQIWFTDLLKN